MIDVVVSGARGRLGGRIAALLAADPDFAPIELVRGDRAEDVILSGRVLVEAATVDAALRHLGHAAAAGVPAVVATTGFSASEQRRLELHGARIAVVLAPNLSVGIAVLTDLVERAARALVGYDLEIVEVHHSRKKDAPSGTAWSLARAAATARGQDVERDAILARAGNIGARGRDEIGIQSLRGGDVVGEHTVMLLGPTERLELVHRAASRDVFATGALRAAHFVASASPGLYTMRDVLGLSV